MDLDILKISLPPLWEHLLLAQFGQSLEEAAEPLVLIPTYHDHLFLWTVEKYRAEIEEREI